VTFSQLQTPLSMNRPKRPRRDFRDSQTFKSVSLLPSSVLDGIFRWVERGWPLLCEAVNYRRTHRFAASKPPTCLKPTSEPSLDLKSLIPLSLVCHSWLRPAIRLLWYRRVTDSLESLSALHSALLIKPNSNSRLRDRVQLYRDSISGFEFRTEAAPDPWTDRDRNQSGLRLVTLLAGILDTCSNLSCVSISDFGILLGSGYVVDHDAIFRAISGSCRTLVLDGIEFSATGLSDVFSRLGRLEEFRVRDYDAPMSNKLHLRGLGECVPESLTRLEIALPDSGATISDSAFTMVFGKVDLEVLKLSRCVELKGETLAIGGGKWTGLRVLEVVRSPMVDNEAFEGIKTRKLEVLRLDKVGATWRAVNAVCQLNKKIKELSLSGKMLASVGFQSLDAQYKLYS